MYQNIHHLKFDTPAFIVKGYCVDGLDPSFHARAAVQELPFFPGKNTMDAIVLK